MLAPGKTDGYDYAWLEAVSQLGRVKFPVFGVRAGSHETAVHEVGLDLGAPVG